MFWFDALGGYHQLSVLPLADSSQLYLFAPKLDSLPVLGAGRYLGTTGIFKFGSYKVRKKNFDETLLVSLSETRRWKTAWICAWHSQLAPDGGDGFGGTFRHIQISFRDENTMNFLKAIPIKVVGIFNVD